MPYQPIDSLDRLMDGAIRERFRVEFATLLANIRDPNTKATAKRSISITVTVSPNANRDVAGMALQVKSKLATAQPVENTIYLSWDDNGLCTASEKVDQIPGQLDMDGNEAPIPNVVTFESKK